MKIIIGILGLMIVILITALWKYTRQVKDICRQLSFLKEKDSNMLITGEFGAGGMGLLVDTLNDFLAMRKEEKKNFLAKEKMIADLYTNLSHDIRTPLTSLDGYIQLLESAGGEEERVRYMGIVKERIRSLKEMLEELFTYTKLRNEAYRVELSECCVNRILKETVFSYYEDWKNLSLEPEIQITEEPLYIQGNLPALRRVIQNVIKNALDHGEKTLKVCLEKTEDGKTPCARLSIGNQMTEPGEINPEQVFERFYKADESRNKNSTGLGLSIAKEFVLRMNGEIRAKAKDGEFCVEIELPLI